MADPSSNGIVFLKRRAWQILQEEYGWKCQFDGRLHELMNAIFISLFDFIDTGGLDADGTPVIINGVVSSPIPQEDKYPNDPEEEWAP